jgi:Ca2+-binding RTX toxin-like protein
MANITFSPGQDIGSVGFGETATVFNLGDFNPNDMVTGTANAGLFFFIPGDLVLSLTGYPTITGFALVNATASGGSLDLTIGQDFYDANAATAGKLTVQGNGSVVTLNAGGLDAAASVTLISVSAGNDVLTGGAGGDNLDGGAGADHLNGGDGFDIARYDNAIGVVANLQTGINTGEAEGDVYSSIEGLSGSLFADTLTGDGGANVLYGESGNDVLAGGAGDDTLIGDSGRSGDNDNDVLVGGAGADHLYGGFPGGPSDIGIDTADYSGSLAGVTVDLSLGTGVGGDAEGDTLSSIEYLVGSALADHLTGGAGVNGLFGGAGDDTLRGGAGSDTLDGGDGSDFANYQGSSAAVTIDLRTGAASGGDAAVDTLTSIENLYGSSHDDSLTGDAGRNIIGGELGDDTLVGNGGDDSLSGEGGADSLDGGDGNDRLVGGDGVDTIHGGIGKDSVDAGTGNDTIFGQEGDDAIVGGDGDDQIAGDDGNDIIEGGAGADAIAGGAGIDTASYAGSQAGVTVNLATGAASGGEAQGDTFSGIEQVLGSGSNDTLTGDGGANTLWGLAGDDVLTGGGGGDVLKGGAGNDSFVYTALSDSAVSGIGKDTIRDFSTGDRIDLSGIDADGNSANGDTAFSFGTGGFTGHAGELRVVTAGSIQVVYVDANGDKAPDFAINVISSGHALTAADFVL